MAKKELFLEESILDDLSDGLGTVERPLADRVFGYIGWLLLVLVLASLGRVAYADLFKESFYRSRALANAGQENILRAPRGLIYDRYGTVLANNQPSFSVSLNLSELLRDKGSVDGTLSQLAAILPLDLAAVKSELMSVDLERQAYVSIAQDVPLNQIIELKKLNIPSVVIENSYVRQYANGPVFSHIVGYTGLVSRDDVSRDQSLSLNDEIGKTGVEASYDQYLRGQNGVALSYRDAKGAVLGTKTVKDPVGGDAIITSIDGDLQKYFYQALKDQLSSLGRSAGAGLVMDPSTGEILSLVSLPSFDNNNLTSNLFVDPGRPTFNRVVSGVYSPGSTIKPLVAFGALEEGIIDPLKKILSIGYIEIPNPYFPDKPSRFVDWRPQGWVDMRAALARSSNVYFYEVGGGFTDQSSGDLFGGGSQAGLGIERLREYWKKFLLDQKTGVDLPGEVSGVLADPVLREKSSGQPWRIGDTYNVSIGQGDLRITPLELLRYISAIPDRGKMPVPHIVDEVKDSGGSVVYNADFGQTAISSKNTDEFSIIEQGMLDGVRKDYGTSHSLADVPMTIAAKTGSAQIQNNQKTNAFFVGYNIPDSTLVYKDGAPRQIAVLVLIEDAKEGSLNAVPVAKKIFQWYYDNRIKSSH